jgi:chloramphenicol-sensitive protein RarD
VTDISVASAGVRGDANHETAAGVRAAIAAYSLWGFLTIYWKQLTEFDPFELIAWRIACAAAVMAVIVTIRHRWGPLLTAMRDRTLLMRLTVAALLITANWTAYVWAVVNDRIIETALGYFMAPLFIMLFGVTLLGEPASKLQRLAFVLGALAVIELTVSYGRVPFIALIISASWALYGLLKRRVPLSPVESLAGETLILALPAIAVLLATAGASDSIPATASGADWVLVALTGFATAVPLMLFAFAAQRLPFTLLGALQYLIPTINLGLGWLVYDEPMPANRIVGFALVWAALIAVTIDQVRPPTRALRDVGFTPTGGG